MNPIYLFWKPSAECSVAQYLVRRAKRRAYCAAVDVRCRRAIAEDERLYEAALRDDERDPYFNDPLPPLPFDEDH